MKFHWTGIGTSERPLVVVFCRTMADGKNIPSFSWDAKASGGQAKLFIEGEEVQAGNTFSLYVNSAEGKPIRIETSEENAKVFQSGSSHEDLITFWDKIVEPRLQEGSKK